jgi:hypothetical protein
MLVRAPTFSFLSQLSLLTTFFLKTFHANSNKFHLLERLGQWCYTLREHGNITQRLSALLAPQRLGIVHSISSGVLSITLFKRFLVLQKVIAQSESNVRYME